MSLAEATSARKLVPALLIAVAAASAAGRICSTSRVYEPELARPDGDAADRRGIWPAKRPTPMPTFSSNDRSRWATVTALVDSGTYVIGRRDKTQVLASAVAQFAAVGPLDGAASEAAAYDVRTSKADSGIIFQDGWQSVDKVLNPQTLEYFSSKPPLLSTLIAGLYWLLQKLFGWTLANEPFAVVRTVLLLVNLAPFVLYLILLARLLERSCASEWTRLFVLAAACFATLVTPFLITLNNHTLGTFCTLFALYPVIGFLRLPSWLGATASTDWNDPPPVRSLATSGFFAGFLVTNELPALALAAALCLFLAIRWPLRTALVFVPAALIPLAALLATNYAALGEPGLAYSKFGGPWYEYEGSHWQRPLEGHVKYGIDWARFHESRATYVFHMLLGHHGWFSLTPIWFLAVAGICWSLKRAENLPRSSSVMPPEDRRTLAVLTGAVSAVVIGYYLLQSDNYGGWTSGLRWLMWLSPLWLLAMVPALDKLSKLRWGRWLALGLLAWSVFSVSYPAWNPWRHPWVYNLLDAEGQIPYMGERRGQ
jgi:hypothetical protein